MQSYWLRNEVVHTVNTEALNVNVAESCEEWCIEYVNAILKWWNKTQT